MRSITKVVLLGAILFVAGCAHFDGKSLEALTEPSSPDVEALQLKFDRGLAAANEADRAAIRRGVEPIQGELTLEEAMARALKYHLERRARRMEEALALNQLDLTRQDMLPSLLARAGYGSRSNDPISESRGAETGQLSPSRFIFRERGHFLSDLSFTWNLLDFGLGYHGSQQQMHRILAATERRRRAMHLLLHDVRIAFWRAATAQRLRPQLQENAARASAALADAVRIEQARVRNPLEAMRYQRQMLENLRQLEAIEQELSAAQVELASLVNAPLGEPIRLAPPSAVTTEAAAALQLPVERLEDVALTNHPDLREHHLNAGIARGEVRKALLRQFPNISFSYGLKYDADNYLVNNDWREAGLQISYNLMNLLTGPAQVRLAEAGMSLAEQRRLAAHMAVLTQVHLARQQLANANAQYARAVAIEEVDLRIAAQVAHRERVEVASRLERADAETAAILSTLRRYQALAQLQAAENRLLASVGLEPSVGRAGELSLPELTEQLRRSGSAWTQLTSAAALHQELAWTGSDHWRAEPEIAGPVGRSAPIRPESP